MENPQLSSACIDTPLPLPAVVLREFDEALRHRVRGVVRPQVTCGGVSCGDLPVGVPTKMMGL